MTTDQVRQLIVQVNRSVHPREIFADSDWKLKFREYAQLLHPDGSHGHFSGATDAMARLNEYKTILERGFEYEDESGKFFIRDNGKTIIFTGDKDKSLLEISYKNFIQLKTKIPVGHILEQYMPQKVQFNNEGQLCVSLQRRSVSILGLKLDEKQVRWMLNRFLEYSGLLYQIGYNHNAISPYSILITPEDHGIQCISWYHMKKSNDKLETISGLISTWYPAEIFQEKRSKIEIDISLSKFFAAQLLHGKISNDPLVNLNGTLDPKLYNFLTKTSKSGLVDIMEYKDYINQLADKDFYKLDL